MYRPVDPQQSFPALELAVLDRWRERDVFAESLARRADAEPWVFYEGPPTANGRPGAHHVLARVFKDIYPRYKTMRGFRVERKGGWDCHGLPVEIAVEKELGLESKDEIEAYGIAAFNKRCRESVFEFLEDWNRLTERIGFWIDLDDAYRTLDDSYVESVWWALEQIHAKGLLYEGHKVVPYCPRCGTALSSHEVALGYRDVEDPSVYVRMGVAGDFGPLVAGDELLIWTTTPWTLVANAAIAADPDLTYVRARLDGTVYVLAASLVDRVLGERADVLESFPGRVLDGAHYRPPFDFIATEAWGERGHTVLMADFVSDSDGTGLVHTAIAFGEDDYRLGTAAGLTVVNPVRVDGTYDERIGRYAGRGVRDSNDELIGDLRELGRLFRAEVREHSYPHCWRCGTPLIYYAKPSWYIATTKLRDRLLAANETVDWHPPHIKHGRFGDWLNNNVDWALSRERYWGTPLPIWRCAEGHVVCIGSFAELERRSGTPVGDPHRPYVDEIGFDCDECGQPMHRVPEVIDVWFDSGAMPFAQHHAPFENAERFERAFPADFICEALDQTRGWFYSLLAVSTLLYDQAPYRNVVCLGLILDDEGQKMSKSKGNVVSPWEVLDRFGADALRWYFFTAKAPWDGYRFSMEAVGEGVQTLLRQLWNTYRLFVLFANATPASVGEAGGQTEAGESSAAGRPSERSRPSGRGEGDADLDRWVRSRLAATVGEVCDRLDAYDTTNAGRAIGSFVDELSNWYVRRSRPRFWAGDPAAFATLRECLLTVARLLAPFTPFVADEIYDNLDGTEASVHLEAFPEPADRDDELEFAMATARETVRLGRAARAQAKVGNRQPLHEAIVVASGRERVAIERLEAIVRDELNVKRLRFVAAADELGSHQVKPNYRTLGPRLGKAMPLAAAAIAALDPQQAAAAVRDGGRVVISIDGHDHELAADDLLVTLAPLDGYGLERDGSHAVALELGIDAELRAERLAREIVHAVQAARKAAGLDVGDRIALELGGDSELLGAATAHASYIAGETLARELTIGGDLDGRAAEPVRIDDLLLRIALARA
ncbi:MAG TPA: isoleucine--tRNA ligase [Solirubrobacteraceae bacterium]|jgi:isoleucyl-tRNA synthetase|nr:isoleucine--tRNA ligase [Solirubrobacteraceae bacterium]